MGIQADCILYCPFEDDAGGGIITSLIGPNGTITGNVSFATAKFNNGERADAENDGCVEFGNLGLEDIGMFELWAKPLLANTVGVGTDALFELYLNNANRIIALLDYGANRIDVRIGSSGGGMDIGWNTTWAANDLIHILVAWDLAKSIPGGKSAILYVDGTERGSSVANFNMAGILNQSGVCHFFNGGPQNVQYNQQVLVDNLKVYPVVNNLTEAIANINNEGWPVGGGRLIDGKMIAPLVGGNLMIN